MKSTKTDRHVWIRKGTGPQEEETKTLLSPCPQQSGTSEGVENKKCQERVGFYYFIVSRFKMKINLNFIKTMKTIILLSFLIFYLFRRRRFKGLGENGVFVSSPWGSIPLPTHVWPWRSVLVSRPPLCTHWQVSSRIGTGEVRSLKRSFLLSSPPFPTPLQSPVNPFPTTPDKEPVRIVSVTVLVV